jgi:hypothetical protein
VSGVPYGDILHRSERPQSPQILAWLQRESVRGAFVERYRSNLTSFQDKVLTNYHLKNPEFINLVSWFLDNPSSLHDKIIVSHEAYLREEGKVNARVELITAVDVHVNHHPNCRRPCGFPSLEDIDFTNLGYSQQTTSFNEIPLCLNKVTIS